MRTTKSYQIENISKFKDKLLNWSSQFYEVVWLDSNKYHQKYSTYDCVLAVDAFTMLKTDYTNAFDNLKEYQSKTNDWLFGYLSYDLKNDTEELESKNQDELNFDDLFFFQPKKIFLIKDNNLEIKYLHFVDDEIDFDFNEIKKFKLIEKSPNQEKIKIKLRTTKDDYFSKLNQVLDHIQKGDIYETNFCQEFYANYKINPLEIFKSLNNISKAPFSTFLKLDDLYLLSASPERYIRKVGTKIISQPIKGTAKRSKVLVEDNQLKSDLKSNLKEQSENVMIVDLVRNDLSKTATKASVRVEELCEVYTFEQVHQLISTVVSEVEFNKNPIELLRTTFPMGSMTGAPKVSAMKIIENLENSKRGLYSGSVGYITPEEDFDFNVIIRSILYNETKEYVSFSVGGAITAKSDPEKEYEECLIKAKAMRSVLENLDDK